MSEDMVIRCMGCDSVFADRIAEYSYCPTCGSRKLERVREDKVEGSL